MGVDERIAYVISHTEVARAPRQTLATFGTTTIHYYMLTRPAYSELARSETEETVIREGTVVAERPKIVTPSYLARLEGFGEEARRYMERLAQEAPHVAGIYYGYRNELGSLTIVSETLEAVIHRMNEQMEKEEDPLAALIKGVDELWDVSLLKFIAELTGQSVQHNLNEFSQRGFLDIEQSGVTRHARYIIDQLFGEAERNISRAVILKQELDMWGLFPEYEDRFLHLFRKSR